MKRARGMRPMGVLWLGVYLEKLKTEPQLRQGSGIETIASGNAGNPERTLKKKKKKKGKLMKEIEI